MSSFDVVLLIGCAIASVYVASVPASNKLFLIVMAFAIALLSGNMFHRETGAWPNDLDPFRFIGAAVVGLSATIPLFRNRRFLHAYVRGSLALVVGCGAIIAWLQTPVWLWFLGALACVILIIENSAFERKPRVR